VAHLLNLLGRFGGAATSVVPATRGHLHASIIPDFRMIPGILGVER
jgi:hypothetical protein